MEAMRITSLISSIIFSIKEIVIVFLLLLFLLSPNSYSLNPSKQHESTLDSTKDVLVEEKSRLGSMPPSCYNKCNQCHPCRAIQVPSLPSHNGVEPSGNVALTQARSMNYAGASKYSNYKPLGWKCRCGVSGTHEHSNSNCHCMATTNRISDSIFWTVFLILLGFS